MIVAIDGPAGAGKSTVTERLASRLGFVRLDTGAIYRAVGLAATRRGIPPTDREALAELVSSVEVRFDDGLVVLDGEDVSEAIRTAEAGQAASAYSAVPEVRAGLLELQRKAGRARDSVVDGRDIGTVVFPDAEVKIFLTASVEARARRRLLDLEQRGQTADLAEVRAGIEARDHADTTRPVAPLRQAEDAVVVDTTHLDLDGAVDACLAVVEQKKTPLGEAERGF